MPLYEYACDACGPFEAWGAMDKATDPCRCPGCHGIGIRQVAAPMLGMMNGNLRKALDRANKSASEPRVMSRQHLDKCGCRTCRPGRQEAGSRRWALGH